jgi:hypothetical protein
MLPHSGICPVRGIHYNGPTLERTLSVRLFGDSKRLETLRGAIIRILRRHDPEAATFDDDEWALLQAHNLNRTPEYVPIAGPLALRVLTCVDNDSVGRAPAIDLRPFQPSVSLSAVMLRNIEVAACDARILVTVENATSFSELLAVRPADLLAVYIGGFASPTIIRLLRTIRVVRPDLPLLHWGDLDAGGLRILAHLRESLGDVAMLAMSSAIVHAYSSFAQPLTTTDRAALRRLREHAKLGDCVPLIDTLLSIDKKLEQEAVELAAVLQEIPLT